MGSFSVTANTPYAVDTSSEAQTANLPQGSANMWARFSDYAGTWNTNNLTLHPYSGDNIEGAASDKVLSTDNDALEITFIDSTAGWIVTKRKRT